MLRRGWLVPLVAFALSVEIVAPTADAQQPATESVSRWVDSILAPVATGRSPGCAVGVRRNGALVLARGYGMADLEHDAWITPETPFYIASLSKQFTAMSIVLLAREGRLSLDDPIRKWVPEVPSVGAPITLRHLLYHTSGLRDYFTLLGVSGWSIDGPLTERDFLALVGRQQSLNFAPGEEFLYSNTGYALLSIVVRRASGRSLREFAAERIFRPLGMTHTQFRDDHTMLIHDRAVGYQRVGETYRLSEPEFDVVGDGGVYSTVDDLARWAGNFETGQVGGMDAIRMLQTPGRLNDGSQIEYALGLNVATFRGRTTYSHSGAYGGYRSAILRLPADHLTVITLCNTSSAPATLTEQISRVFLGVADETASTALPAATAGLMALGAAQAPGDSSMAQRRNDLLAELAGTYFSSELELTIGIAARDGVLVLSRPHAADLRFIPLAEDLLMNNERMLLRVRRNGSGRVNALTLTVGRVRDLAFVRRDASP